MAEQVVYCTVADVQRWVKRVQFSAATKVTLSDIDSYIQTASAIVEGELRSLGVTLPMAASSKVSLGILKSLVAFEAASYAEQAVNFGSNKNVSTHGKYLHDKYLDLLEQIRLNPSLLLDVVTTGVNYMKSDTEDMLEGGTKEGDEIFTKKHIDDFRDDNKVLSQSEKSSEDESITGSIDRSRV